MVSAVPMASAFSGKKPLLLWSTNSWLKHYIQMRFRNDTHYVWCSPIFEGQSAARYAVGAGQPPTSDPATIYRQLHIAVSRQDGHDPKIASQRTTIKALAAEWFAVGELTEDERDEILAIVDRSTVRDWRPVLFVIPFDSVGIRVKSVPREKRASLEPEYIIPDLSKEEFELIEPVPCS